MTLIKNFWLFLVWLFVILYLSFTPLTNWPQPTLFQKLYIDKVVHIFMYAALSFLLLRGFFLQQKKQHLRYALIVTSLIICAGLGVAVEFLQPVLTMYRRFEWMDMVANATGVVTGWLIFSWLLSKQWLGLKTMSTNRSFSGSNDLSNY